MERIFLGGKGGWCIRLINLPLYVPIVWKSGILTLLETQGPFQACNAIALPFERPEKLCKQL